MGFKNFGGRDNKNFFWGKNPKISQGGAICTFGLKKIFGLGIGPIFFGNFGVPF